MFDLYFGIWGVYKLLGIFINIILINVGDIIVGYYYNCCGLLFVYSCLFIGFVE